MTPERRAAISRFPHRCHAGGARQPDPHHRRLSPRCATSSSESRSLPPDLASKRDVAMLRPLRIRQIITQNCVECHSTRRLGVTVSMEPSEIQRTVERMQNHPGANIPHGEFERITASLLVARCARCHGEETLNLMVLKTQPERLATIRRMAALPGSGVRADQALAIAQAFEKLIEEGTDRDNNLSPVQSAR